MSIRDALEAVADVASIATAVIASLAYGTYRWANYRNRKRVEDYLWDIVVSPRWPNDPGERTVDQLVTELGMSDQDIMAAVFSSKWIHRELGGSLAPITARLKLSHKDKYAAARVKSN